MKWLQYIAWYGLFVVGFFGFGTAGAIIGHPWDTIALIVMGVSGVLGMIAFSDGP